METGSLSVYSVVEIYLEICLSRGHVLESSEVTSIEEGWKDSSEASPIVDLKRDNVAGCISSRHATRCTYIRDSWVRIG